MKTVSTLRRAALLAVTLPVLLSACASPRVARDPLSQPLDGTARLVVHNQNWEAMAVFVVRGGTPFRLGIVEGLSSRSFTVPASYLSTASAVELMAETRISRVMHRLPAVPYTPGSNLECVLGSQPFLSLVRVM